MSSSLRLDPEYSEWLRPQMTSGKVPPIFNNIADLRRFTETILVQAFATCPPADNIIKTTYMIPAADGTQVKLYRFATQEQLDASAATDPQPAVLYFHGGGLVACSVDIFAPAIAHNAASSGVQFWSVEYRLAPEHPHPTPLNDCWAALSYISGYSRGFGIDSKRIAVMGDSAGGCLAAGLALMARDRELSPPPAKQILVYPMLDDRTVIRILPDSDHPIVKFLTWNSKDNAVGWDAYLGPPRKAEDVSPEIAVKGLKAKEGRGVSCYAAPARCEDLSGLPSTYIDVGGLDLFRDENASYATRLAAANVEVEFHMYPGVPHGFEQAATTGVVKRALENRRRAIKSF